MHGPQSYFHTDIFLHNPQKSYNKRIQQAVRKGSKDRGSYMKYFQTIMFYLRAQKCREKGMRNRHGSQFYFLFRYMHACHTVKFITYVL